MNLLQHLASLISQHPQAPTPELGHPQLQAHAQATLPLAQLLPHLAAVSQQNSTPDITYNPNPNVDIPYSAHTPELAQLGNQYVANPYAPQTMHIDPGLFGFPADGSGGVNPNQMFRQPQGTPYPRGNRLQSAASPQMNRPNQIQGSIRY